MALMTLLHLETCYTLRADINKWVFKSFLNVNGAVHSYIDWQIAAISKALLPQLVLARIGDNRAC